MAERPPGPCEHVVEFGKDGTPPAEADGRLDAPAFHRNHTPIWSVLSGFLLGRRGDVLEIGSGIFLGCSLLLAGGTPSALSPLVVDGPELHASLVTRKLEDAAKLHLAPVLRANPYLSTDADFVDVLARIASQGRLDGGQGIRAALYALYLGESDVGLYGLEAASAADADRIEGVLRAIWAHNEKLERAHVHREGNVLVVAWNNGVSPSCWQIVNAAVEKLLTVPSKGP